MYEHEMKFNIKTGNSFFLKIDINKPNFRLQINNKACFLLFKITLADFKIDIFFYITNIYCLIIKQKYIFYDNKSRQ